MIKLISIVGIRGKFKVCCISADGSFQRRYYNNIDQCFKWLASFQKHTRKGVQS